MKTMQQVYREQINMFTEDVKQMITDIFEQDKFIAPVAIALVVKEDRLSIVILAGLGELFVNDAGKGMAAEVMKELNKQIKPVAFAFATEGYASVYDGKETDLSEILDENGNMKTRPSEDPNRREVIIISFETHDQTMMKLYDINRTEEQPFLVEAEGKEDWIDKKEGVYQGRMGNLLRENYSELAEMLKKQLGHQLN